MKAALSETSLALLMGADADADAAFERITGLVTSVQRYEIVVVWLAGCSAHVLVSARDRLPTRARTAMFTPDLRATTTPVQVAAVRIVTAIANDDMDMVSALVRPWAHGRYGEAAAGDLLTQLGILARGMRGHACPGCAGGGVS